MVHSVLFGDFVSRLLNVALIALIVLQLSSSYTWLGPGRESMRLNVRPKSLKHEPDVPPARGTRPSSNVPARGVRRVRPRAMLDTCPPIVAA